MSKYGLNKKTYHERQESNPEFVQVHNRLVFRIVYFLRLFGCGVYVANESEQQEKKFDFKTKMKGETSWTAWDVKIAENLPKQFCGVQTELNCVLNLLMWQGLGRFNNNNHIFWLLAQARKNIADSEYDATAKRIAKQIISGKTLKNIRYCLRGANQEDRDLHPECVNEPKIMRQAILVTNRPLDSI